MQVKKLLSDFNIKPRKRLGQHFLIANSYLERIVEHAEITSDDVVLEPGAGMGNLTQLLARKAGKVLAVELDKKLCDCLKTIFKDDPKVRIIESDVLKLKFKDFIGEGPLKIVGNPPYYISSQFLEKLVEERQYISSAFLSLQREYFERMISKPGNKSYSRLSIFVQTFFDVKPLFKIPRSCFYPKPEVESVFFKLSPKSNLEIKDHRILDELTREFFQKRRKRLARIVKDSTKLQGWGIIEILQQMHIDLNKRPEDISVEEYIKIANKLRR